MPTYEYACAECGHQWEEVQRITAPPLEVCPKCSKSAAHRLISGGTNFILKGGGWYSDLYASPGGASKKTEGGSSGSTESSSKSEKSESTSTPSESKSTPTESKSSAAAPAGSSSSPSAPSSS